MDALLVSVSLLGLGLAALAAMAGFVFVCDRV